MAMPPAGQAMLWALGLTIWTLGWLLVSVLYLAGAIR